MNNNFNIAEPYPGWLDEFVTTKEAEQLTGVPAETLTTKRSVGGGPSALTHSTGTGKRLSLAKISSAGLVHTNGLAF